MPSDFAARFGSGNDDLLRAATPAAVRAAAGGRVLGRGLYRILSENEAKTMRGRLAALAPDMGPHLDPFGSDWLGRVFAVHPKGHLVAMAEPGTGEVLEIPVGLQAFHAAEIVEHADAALAVSFFEEWLRTTGGPAPRADQCLGYRKPLFLGGSDTVDNLEMSDMDVYWSIMTQMIRELRRRG